MSDDKKPLGLRNSSGPGHVKQSFSHGRSKSVVVEKKRKRVIVPGKGGADASGGPRPAGVSDLELDRRKKALMAAAAQENDRKAREEAETKTREAERAETDSETHPEGCVRDGSRQAAQLDFWRGHRQCRVSAKRDPNLRRRAYLR